MKLYFSPASPFVRKVLISGIELNLDDRIENLSCAVHVIKRDLQVVERNPLGKVPTFISDDGVVLYDSRVICEYLDALAGGCRLFPADLKQRFPALTEQALADGMLDAALLARQEVTIRPSNMFWQPWRDAQMAKISSALDRMNESAGTFDGRIDIGTISTACALGYLQFRFADLDWRTNRPVLSQWFSTFSSRPSMQRTIPS